MAKANYLKFLISLSVHPRHPKQMLTQMNLFWRLKGKGVKFKMS